MPRPLTSYFVATAATFLLVTACRDDTTAPNESPDAGGTHSTGQSPPPASGDTAHTAPATPVPSPTGDTARTTPPPPAASSIQLAVYVGVATPGPDTLKSTPVANARVTVLSRSYTRGTGPDTLVVTETPVVTGSTDALGKVSFANLPAVGYRIEAVVEGRAGSPASIQIAPPYPGSFATWIIFRPAP